MRWAPLSSLTSSKLGASTHMYFIRLRNIMMAEPRVDRGGAAGSMLYGTPRAKHIMLKNQCVPHRQSQVPPSIPSLTPKATKHHFCSSTRSGLKRNRACVDTAVHMFTCSRLRYIAILGCPVCSCCSCICVPAFALVCTSWDLAGEV